MECLCTFFYLSRVAYMYNVQRRDESSVPLNMYTQLSELSFIRIRRHVTTINKRNVYLSFGDEHLFQLVYVKTSKGDTCHDRETRDKLVPHREI